MPDYQRELHVAIEAADRAARLIRHHAGRVAGEDISDKGWNELVTRIDEEAQTLIAQHLRRAFPTYAVLGEEGDTDPAVLAPTYDGYRWIIDPIDGTTNFTHGLPPYAVSIALQRANALVVGVVLNVPAQELFTATRGGGAQLNGRPLHVSQTASLTDSLVTTGFPYRSFSHADVYLDVLKQFMARTRGVRRPGAASVDLAYVACGRFDGFFETGLNAWDVAAGTLLVEEAGGRVTDYHDRPDAVFARQLLATNQLVHAEMLEILSPMQEETA